MTQNWHKPSNSCLCPMPIQLSLKFQSFSTGRSRENSISLIHHGAIFLNYNPPPSLLYSIFFFLRLTGPHLPARGVFAGRFRWRRLCTKSIEVPTNSKCRNHFNFTAPKEVNLDFVGHATCDCVHKYTLCSCLLLLLHLVIFPFIRKRDLGES